MKFTIKNKKALWAGIAIIVAVVAVVLIVIFASNSSAKVYNATADKFSIKYPGTPTVTTASQAVASHDVSYTTYDSKVDNNKQEYVVYAYNWPAQYFNFAGLSNTDMKTAIKGSADGVIQLLSGTTTSSSYSTYLGHTSIDVQFTSSNPDGGTGTNYIRVFFVGNREYAIMAGGATSKQFNNFANSFKAL